MTGTLNLGPNIVVKAGLLKSSSFGVAMHLKMKMGANVPSSS